MADRRQNEAIKLEMDAGNLYREETITDLRAGSIMRLIPITVAGAEDATRPVRYIARTQIMSDMGVLPIEAPIEAASLADALARFPQAVETALDELARRIEQRQREAANRIITPDQLAGGRGGPGGGPGNLII